MELYVGMDVSLKETSICVVDGSGPIVKIRAPQGPRIIPNLVDTDPFHGADWPSRLGARIFTIGPRFEREHPIHAENP